MKIKILLILLSSLLFGVTDLTSKNYDKETEQGIVVVEYWATWNTQNMVIAIDELKNSPLYLSIKKVKVFRVNICENIDLQTKYGITVVPTIIFYDNGKEFKRLQGDLSFKLKTTYEELQKIIDDRLMINQEK